MEGSASDGPQSGFLNTENEQEDIHMAHLNSLTATFTSGVLRVFLLFQYARTREINAKDLKKHLTIWKNI